MKIINMPAAPLHDDSAYLTDAAQSSAAVRAQLQLRELILAGDFPGGMRIAELAIVQKLGMSRTPIRAALMRLEQEGLLEALPSGGFAVKTFSAPSHYGFGIVLCNGPVGLR